MKKIILIAVLFCSLIAKSQINNSIQPDSIPKPPRLPNDLSIYYKFANEAKWNFFNKKYNEAIVGYKKAFTFHKPQALHLFDLVDCFRAISKNDSALKYAKYCIENFGSDYQRTFEDSLLDAYYNQELFKPSLGKFYTKDMILRNMIMIEHYLYNDFLFRNKFNELNFDEGNCIKNKGDFAFKIALQYDSVYAIPFVLKLIKDYNFPNEYDIGCQSVKHIMFLLRHYNWEKYILDSALVNGKILPEEYASLVDYHFNKDWKALVNGGKFRPKDNYGPNLRKVGEVFIMGEIDDIENVDKRRDEIGLMPLWQYAKYKKFELSNDYKKVLAKQKIKYE